MASSRPCSICRYSSSISAAGASMSVRATDPGWKSVILSVMLRATLISAATMETKFLIWNMATRL